MKSIERITSIKNFRRQAYLPRLGKVRLGILKHTATGKEYPSEVDYFVCPPEVIKAYGGEVEIKKLDIIFPSENIEDVIPFCYKRYGGNQRLQCRGDGEFGYTVEPTTGEIKTISCPCDLLKQKKCSQRGHLMVILPKVSLGGVYQIDTGSTININRIMDAMVYWQRQVGRCKGLPLTLERIAEKIPDPVTGKMNTHFLFRFGTEINLETVNKAIENKEAFLQMDFKVARPIEDGKLDDPPREDVIDLDPETKNTDTPPQTPEPDKSEDEKKSRRIAKIAAVQMNYDLKEQDDNLRAWKIQCNIDAKKTLSEMSVSELDALVELAEKQEPTAKSSGEKCSKCGGETTEKVAKFSKDKFGAVICFKCQQKRTGK